MVRKDKKQYIVLSKNQVRTMKNQGNAIANDRMKEARAMMQEKMKNMSPQQRAMAEQMLKRMGGGNSAANKAAPTKKPKKKNRKAVATKRFSKVSGIRCKIYKVYTNGKQKGEVCVAKAKKLGLTKKEVNTMRRMFATMEEVRQASTAARMMPRDNKMMTLLKQVDGIPIQFTGTKNLEPKGGLLSISKKKKAGRFFKVPKSYSKFDMSAMGHRH